MRFSHVHSQTTNERDRACLFSIFIYTHFITCTDIFPNHRRRRRHRFFFIFFLSLTFLFNSFYLPINLILEFLFLVCVSVHFMRVALLQTVYVCVFIRWWGFSLTAYMFFLYICNNFIDGKKGSWNAFFLLCVRMDHGRDPFVYWI